MPGHGLGNSKKHGLISKDITEQWQEDIFRGAGKLEAVQKETICNGGCTPLMPGYLHKWALFLKWHSYFISPTIFYSEKEETTTHQAHPNVSSLTVSRGNTNSV